MTLSLSLQYSDMNLLLQNHTHLVKKIYMYIYNCREKKITSHINKEYSYNGESPH